MRAKLARLNDCAVPFLSRATANLCWYYYTYLSGEVEESQCFPHSDYTNRYLGHFNCQTDIKESNFFGPNQVRQKFAVFLKILDQYNKSLTIIDNAINYINIWLLEMWIYTRPLMPIHWQIIQWPL